mmetsp:Transcript_26506/g.84031  ORF Transcript_26506/g.84031 Transcript_26506/m.84031 type:complete len:292 (-) Transcript_26506:643-1518(-)
MLLLALLSRVGNLRVQLPDALAEGGDLALHCRHLLLGLVDGLADVRDLQGQRLELASGLALLRLAVVALLVVVVLLLSQEHHHVVNHLEDLVEAGALRPQRHRDEVQAPVVATVAALLRGLHHLQRHDALGLVFGRCLDLEEGGRGQGLLEQCQGVVFVQELDRVRKCLELLSPHLFANGPLVLLGFATLFEVRQVTLVLLEGLGCVVQVSLQVDNVDPDFADARDLLLDLLLERGYLLLLRLAHDLLLLLGAGVLALELVQVRLHFVPHRLQDTNDLTRLGLVAAIRLVR